TCLGLRRCQRSEVPLGLRSPGFFSCAYPTRVLPTFEPGRAGEFCPLALRPNCPKDKPAGTAKSPRHRQGTNGPPAGPVRRGYCQELWMRISSGGVLLLDPIYEHDPLDHLRQEG